MTPLSTKGRYAARIMVYLARHKNDAPMTKHNIGAAEDISANYVEQLMIRLKASQLVRSHRGRNGGFSLARDPDRITLADVLHAVEGPVAFAPCLYGTCGRERSCPTRPVWKKAAEAVEDVFAGTTIARMAERSACQCESTFTYQI